MKEQLQSLEALLDECPLRPARAFHKRIGGLRRRLKQHKPIDRGLQALTNDVQKALQEVQRRRGAIPAIQYPEALPVSERRHELAEAIATHQVVVVAGETGSGKTTQLPKICLELGRGIKGLIGHTQPRRIAARSVAARIAEELGSAPGSLVGYKVRFHDHLGPQSCIKLMTDGILLAEIQSDPLLEQYDTLIIDEAHERSLNIDFLLGYLKQLLPKRPDLKLIITSATINTESFSAFFNQAPVIEVSGRTYPVDVHYRPLLGEDEDDKDQDMQQAIADAVQELGRIDPLGDILIFLSGERPIREAAEFLRKQGLRDTEILPLFSRLSASEQDRIFRSHRGRRIVLATNVAETSLTVPGIRFVIDTGQARISRYSARSKVQRLPVENISQASANQRAGRCGRVSAGVCIRLYSEEDFLSRPLYTEPEILRTNLSSVILQMSSMGLGDISAFPFLAVPEGRQITDGYRLLQELKAFDEAQQLTGLGRKLARLPIDPRLGAMLLAADRERSLSEVLTIVSALSIQDPRERPLEAQQKADQCHARFKDEQSDFLSLLKLWDYYHEQARHLSQNKLRKLCKGEFISYLRMREWHEIHGQLKRMVLELELRLNDEEAGYDAIHRALLTGLLGNIALREELDDKAAATKAKGGKGKSRKPQKEYLGARGNKLVVFPGSGLAKKPPKWLMAAELVETRRLFARTVAHIEPKWLEELGSHLLKFSYSEPHWEKRPAQVAAFARGTLYGLTIIPKRRVNYGPIDPPLSRELFIRHALVEGEYHSDGGFFHHNRKLVEELEAMEAKSRRRDILVDEQVMFEFYDRHIPPDIYSGRSFEKWRKGYEKEQPKGLYLQKEDLLRRDSGQVDTEAFPDQLRISGQLLPLRYHFEPGSIDDGVSVLIPLGLLNHLRPAPFEWLVPGLLEEKLVALIKGLPKSLRRNFVPAPQFAAAALANIKPGEAVLHEALGHQLLRITGVQVAEDDWLAVQLPTHLRMNFRVLDEKGKSVAEGRDLAQLQQSLSGTLRRTLAQPQQEEEDIHNITDWNVGRLPNERRISRNGLELLAYPALVDEGESCALRMFESAAAAHAAHEQGVLRLFILQSREKVKYLLKEMKKSSQACLLYNAIGPCDELQKDLIRAAVRQSMMQGHELPRDEQEFQGRLKQGQGELVRHGNLLLEQVQQILKLHHALQKRLKKACPPDYLPALEDIRTQLTALIHPGFLEHTPATWLAHFPRYLQAVESRLEKLGRNMARDRQGMHEVQVLTKRYQEYRQKHPERIEQQEFVEFRWLLEELRVSLFAQELKTLQSVSFKRLEKRWGELTR